MCWAGLKVLPSKLKRALEGEGAPTWRYLKKWVWISTDSGLFIQKIATLGSYPCSHHRGRETEACGGQRAACGGLGVSSRAQSRSKAQGSIGCSARFAVLPPLNPQWSRAGRRAAWFLACTLLSGLCRSEVSERQACAGEPWSELLAVWWRISFMGFRSSWCSRIQEQKSLSVPMWKVPCGLVPAPSFASAETYIT